MQVRICRSSKTGHSSGAGHRRVAGAALTLAGLLVVAPGHDALGYRFFWADANAPAVPRAAEAVRWSPNAWGDSPLQWTLTEGWTEEWEDYDGSKNKSSFATKEDVEPFLQKALDAWAALDSAEISWGIGGHAGELHMERDQVNSIRAHPYDPGASYAVVWQTAEGIVECDISMSPFHLQNTEGLGLTVMIHELGHCLGLAHVPSFPTWDTSAPRRGQPAIWDTDPNMSYGYQPQPGLTEDDVVGISLLRPAAGWLATVGTISGEMKLGDGPARYSAVYALRISGDRAVASAATFTNGEGAFAIEGLRPGEYLLVAGTMGAALANEDLLDRGASLGGADQYLLDPVRVTAGGETRIPPIRLRETRKALAINIPEQPEQ